MTPELAQLTALLDRWDTLIDEAARKVETTTHPVQGAFYAGVMFGMESARDDLAAALASVLKQSTSLE